MNSEDPLQQNIRRAAGQQALRQIGKIVEEDRNIDAAKARYVGWLLRYGWIILLLIAAVVGRLTGVY